MDIILFGIQGSGKGTQGKLIAEKYNLAIFETGGQLRKLAQNENPLGLKIKNVIESGNLVSNEVVMEIVENFLNNISKETNVLFDGIPRTLEQNETLTNLLKSKNREYKGLVIDISTKEALKRLTTRRICPKCKGVYPVFYEKNTCAKCNIELITRTDDNIESINTRLITYEKETLPIIEKYAKENNLININGQQSIENVTKDIEKALDQIY